MVIQLGGPPSSPGDVARDEHLSDDALRIWRLGEQVCVIEAEPGPSWSRREMVTSPIGSEHC